MDLNDLRQQLEQNIDPQGRLSVLFVQKNGLIYRSYNPEVSNEVQGKIIEIFLSRIQSFIDDCLIEVPFNPSGQLVGEYSTCTNDYVGNFNEVEGLFNNFIDEEIAPDNITFLIHRLRVNQDDQPTKYLYFFRRNQKMKNLRKGFWMRKVRDTYDVLESELIGIDNFIDAIAYEGEISFFAHISAERIFNLREKFTENAETILRDINAGNTIENFEEFSVDCLNDARITRRLTKIYNNPQILELFHAHFDRAPEVVELFDLNISFNEDNTKIIYEDKSQLTDITMLLRDAYYRTVLANRTGIDDYNN